MRIPFVAPGVFFAVATCFAVAKPPSPVPSQVPSNGVKATVLHATNLYVAPDKSSARLSEITPGREMVIVERNGPWIRVFANTDMEISNELDKPVFGNEAAADPTSGWVDAAGVVSAQTPRGDQILFGVAATEEVEAAQPHSPQSTAQAARLLYQRVPDFFPNSPLVPEAVWRTADIRWQLQKADVFSLPSAREKEAYLREQIDETEMRRLQKRFPNSRWSDLAAWDMLDNKICGDWQGSTSCPEKEAAMYEKYAQDRPDSPKAAEALYEAVYRRGVLADMYGADGDNKKADDAKARAAAIADNMLGKYPTSDYTARAAGLVYKLQAGIPIYGTDRE